MRLLWRTPSVPARRLPPSQPRLGISLGVLKIGTISSNFFLGSGVLIGAAEAVVVVLQ
jgi:hypothetical protein